MVIKHPVNGSYYHTIKSESGLPRSNLILYNCSKCNILGFPSLGSLRNHLLNCSERNLILTQEEDPNYIPEKENMKKCGECEFQTEKWIHLEMHRRFSHTS
uniref:Uncharacterized protein n=1 Tax=Lepeophtheirus salmonis TaxID=72036 RepID=A0A0K2UG54_LEPSM